MSDLLPSGKRGVVRTKLIEVARRRELVTYGEVGEWIGMNPRLVGLEVLDPINEVEHAAGRPLLSALVVLKTLCVPGLGFWAIAEKLGRYDGQVQAVDRALFWAEERQRVYSYWAPE